MINIMEKFGLQIARAYIALFATLLAGFPTVGFGATPHLVRNINVAVVPQSSSPQYLGALGNVVLFGASDATSSSLWATGGTASSTILLRRVKVFAQITYPGSPNYIVMNSRGYFVGDDGVNGWQLWSTDGTAAGTAMVANLGPSGTTASPLLYGVVGSLLVFSKVDASGTAQLYVTDGTSAGTRALTSLSEQSSYVSSEFLIVGNKFYFAAGGVTGGIAYGQIWVSDGTAAGTRRVSNPYGNSSVGTDAELSPRSFTLVGSSVIYMAGGLLWSIDTITDTLTGVAASGGTLGFGPPQVNEAAGLIGMDGYVLCIANGLAFGSQELWRSDGTVAGTYRVAVINPGPASFNAQQYPLLKKVGNRVLFIGSDSQYGSQLWSSDGTSANTIRLTNASAPANAAFQIAIYKTTIAGIAYLSISDGSQTTTWSIWRTDGTLAGTQRASGLPSIDHSVAGLTQVIGNSTTVYVEVYGASGTTSLFKYQPAADSTTLLKNELSTSTFDSFLFVTGKLYFSANDPVFGNEPWISDGTPTGTQPLVELYPQMTDMGASPDEFVNFNGALVFVADDGVYGRELWQSDGTTAGTVLLTDINPGSASSNPSNLFVANGVLYFFAADASGNQKFMRLSGNPVAFQELASISPPPLGTYPPFLPACGRNTPVLLNGQIYFAAYTGVAGVELWNSDGTSTGTHLVYDINPGFGDSNPCQLTVFNSQLYFSATSSSGNELWITDGTSGGTQQVIDIAPGFSSSSPVGLTVFNSALYFGATNGTNGRQLWRSNGFAAGTASVGSIVQNANTYATPIGIAGSKLLIDAVITQSQLGIFQNQLWASDGTNSGEINLSVSRVGSAFLVNGGLAYFSTLGAVGAEPWITDGTSAGTRLLKDINPTAQTSLLWFANFNGITLFAANDPITGGQLWRSDATATGTTLISNVPADIPTTITLASNRRQLAVGQTFFFVGNESSTGSELYALANDPPIASPYAISSTNSQPVSVNVLANDSDPDGSLDAASVRVLTNPGHGMVTVGTNGTITFTPVLGFEGTDSFTYTVNDNQGATSNVATVTVSVTSPTITAENGRGGGGGPIDFLSLFGLISCWTVRRISMRKTNN